MCVKTPFRKSGHIFMYSYCSLPTVHIEILFLFFFVVAESYHCCMFQLFKKHFCSKFIPYLDIHIALFMLTYCSSLLVIIWRLPPPLYCRYHLFNTPHIVHSNEDILLPLATQRSYKAGIRQYTKFCRNFTLHNIPTLERTLLLFSTHLVIHGLQSESTCQLWDMHMSLKAATAFLILPGLTTS